MTKEIRNPNVDTENGTKVASMISHSDFVLRHSFDI